MAIFSLRDLILTPRAALRRILDLNLPMSSRWQIFLILAVASALFSHLFLWLVGGTALMGASLSPFFTGAIQALLLLIVVGAVQLFGRAFGGTARFADTLLGVSVLQGVMVIAQCVQLLLYFALPVLGEIAGFAAVILFFWLLTNFVTELHGFRSRVRVFMGVIFAVFCVASVLALLFGSLATMPPGPPPAGG